MAYFITMLPCEWSPTPGVIHYDGNVSGVIHYDTTLSVALDLYIVIHYGRECCPAPGVIHYDTTVSVALYLA